MEADGDESADGGADTPNETAGMDPENTDLPKGGALCAMVGDDGSVSATNLSFSMLDAFDHVRDYPLISNAVAGFDVIPGVNELAFLKLYDTNRLTVGKLQPADKEERDGESDDEDGANQGPEDDSSESNLNLPWDTRIMKDDYVEVYLINTNFPDAFISYEEYL